MQNSDGFSNSEDENLNIDLSSVDTTTETTAEDEERALLLANTDLIKGEQLKISLTGEIHSEPEIREYALGHVTDPENMYQVYYKGIDRLLRRFLPQSKRFKVDKDRIYEEKNTYLTRGHRIGKNGIRGADGRMGYASDAEVVLNLVIDWSVNSRNMAVLYKQLLELNVRSGYGLPTL